MAQERSSAPSEERKPNRSHHSGSGSRTVGHPINVATGAVYAIHRDLWVPGQPDLTFERRYSTDLLGSPPGALGLGWTCEFFSSLDIVAKGYQLVLPEGELQTFEDPESRLERGELLANLATFQELSKRGSEYLLTRWDPITGLSSRLFFRWTRGTRAVLSRVEDRDRNALLLHHDSNDFLIAIEQPNERRKLNLCYNRKNLLESIRLELNGEHSPVANYEYDEDRRLRLVSNALGARERYEYDKAGRLMREVGRDGAIFSFVYDDSGRCTHTSGLDRYDEKGLAYFPDLGWTEVTDSHGNVTRFQWTPTGQVVSEIDPVGGCRETDYDDLCRPTEIRFPGGRLSKFKYDDAGNCCEHTTDSGTTITEFSASHQITKITDAGGRTWTREYDGRGLWSSIKDPTGDSTRFHYDEQGRFSAETDPLGASTRLEYGDSGQIAAFTDRDGRRSRLAYNSLGRILSWENAAGHVTRFEYDAVGNPTSVIRADGASSSYTYDAAGNIIAARDALGRETRLRYGPCSRILERSEPDGSTIRFEWGTEPRELLAVVNEQGERHEYQYDPAGRLTGERCFDGRVLAYSRDSAGRCIRAKNGADEEIEFEFDAAGRLTRKTYSDGASASYEYDVYGNLVGAANGSCTVVIERDAHGRAVRETINDFEVHSWFDSVGNLTRRNSNLGHESSFAYNESSQLTRLECANRVIRISRDEVGGEIERTIADGLRLLQRFDARGRLTDQLVEAVRDSQESRHFASKLPFGSSGNREEIHRRYRYEPTGELAEMEEVGRRERRYQYDARGFLASVEDGERSERFTYDGAGNILSIAPADQQASHLTYAAGNRLQQKGSTQYEYDANSRLLRCTRNDGTDGPETARFEWDADDQLIAYTDPRGGRWEYSYDPLGRRIAKKSPDGQITKYLWAGDLPLQCVEPSGRTSTWLFDPRSFRALAMVDETGELHSIIPDHLGTPREMVDPDGNISWRAWHTAWGETTVDTLSRVQNPLRFPGQWEDTETGLHYSWFRYYDPHTGRYLAPDPIGLNGGTNEFRYVRNPTGWIDPFGLQDCGGDDEEPVQIVIDADRYPEAAQHISDNGPVIGRIDRPGASRRRRESLRGTPTQAGTDRDEVPPAILDTGGSGASIRRIPPGDNRGAGSTMGHQMRDLPDGTLVQVVSSKDV